MVDRQGFEWHNINTNLVRLHFTIAIIVASSVLTACADPNTTNVEVTPKLYWHINDYAGEGPGSPDYHEITNYWTTNFYTPFVISQGTPFTMDFAQHDSFTSPDTLNNEEYFDGVMTEMTVSVSNTTAYFSGRAEYHLHLGTTSAYMTGAESLYGETLRSFSTRFRGTCDFGDEMQIGAGEDVNDEPVVCFTFRQTSAPLSKFDPISQNFNGQKINPYQNIDEGMLRVIGSDFYSKRIVSELEYYAALNSTYTTNHFYVGAIKLDGTNLVTALVYWKEPRVILNYGELDNDASDGHEIEAWGWASNKLDRDTVDTTEEIDGSNYLITHRQWVDWMEQCVYEGKSYTITLNESTNAFPNVGRSKPDND